MVRRILPASVSIGAATSAYQIEGGLDGLTDIGLFGLLHPQFSGGDYIMPAGRACEHYERFEQDLDLVKSLGLETFRFGIEWARIEPRRGEINNNEIKHYRKVLEACRIRGITPIVTLHHFTNPRWVITQGGWGFGRTDDYFARFASHIAGELGGLIEGSPEKGEKPGYICTLNEINTGALNATDKGTPEERVQAEAWMKSAKALKVDPMKFRPWKFASNPTDIQMIVRAHQKAYIAIKNLRPNLPVGFTMASQAIVPLDPDNSAHVLKRDQVWHQREGQFWVELLKHPELLDFAGVQPYTYLRCDETGILPPPPDAPLVKQGYEVGPQAMEHVLRNTHQLLEPLRPGLPLVVTEFGIGTDDDKLRIEYFKHGFNGLIRCVDAGMNIPEVQVWSLLDNFEWRWAYGPRYGVVHMDYDTQIRTPKPSAGFLSRLNATRAYEFDPKSLDEFRPSAGPITDVVAL